MEESVSEAWLEAAPSRSGGPGEWRREGGLVWWEAVFGSAWLAFTTRIGGASVSPYDTLNLGLHVGDAPATVLRNRARLWSAVTPGSAPPVIAEQVHGVTPAVVGTAEAGRGWEARETAISDTDALVTRDAGVALAMLVADCAPVALVAPEGVLGLAHAGWRGLANGVLEATLRQMAALGGGPPHRYRALVGPCIRACCYEVGEEVWRHFPESCLAPAGRPTARRLDLMAAVVHRLEQAGLPPEQISTLGLCTACHPDLFFSHRRATREGLPTTGRLALLGRVSSSVAG
jgi:polyphenol oxidase